MAIVFLLLGAYGGWFVFTKVLGKPYPEEGIRPAADQPAKKDTVFVKLVDQALPTAGWGNTFRNQSRDTTDTGRESNTQPLQGPENNQTFTLNKQTGAKLPSAIVADVSDNVYNNAQRLSDLEDKHFFKNIFRLPHIWVALGISLLILVVAFFTKDDEVLNAIPKDVPPPVLERLFHKMSAEINLFHNPRKILRYRNAVSYHYYFFKQKQLDTEQNIEKMMWLLLAIHRDSSIVDTSDVTDAALAGPDWFLQKTADNKYVQQAALAMPGDMDMLMMVLKLNADMG